MTKKNILIFLIFLVLGAVVVYVRDERADSLIRVPTTPDQTTAGKRDTLLTPPAKAAEDFYHVYENCMKNPPQEAIEHVSEYCQTNNPFGAESLVANLTSGGVANAGADPVFCAQNPPQSYSITGATPIENGQSTATVEETFGEGDPTIIKVATEEHDSTWKITNIICPTPQ